LKVLFHLCDELLFQASTTQIAAQIRSNLLQESLKLLLLEKGLPMLWSRSVGRALVVSSDIGQTSVASGRTLQC